MRPTLVHQNNFNLEIFSSFSQVASILLLSRFCNLETLLTCITKVFVLVRSKEKCCFKVFGSEDSKPGRTFNGLVLTASCQQWVLVDFNFLFRLSAEVEPDNNS